MHETAHASIGVDRGRHPASAGSAQIFDNPFDQYFEREITIEPGSGNAKDANAAIHTIDPWSRYSRDTRIRVQGRQAVEAITGPQIYLNPNPFGRPGAGGGAGTGAAGGFGAGGGGSGTGMGGSTPMQPVSSGGY